MSRGYLFNFVENGVAARLKVALALYVVIYRLITPFTAAALEGSLPELWALRLCTTAVEQFVLFSPIILFKRVGYLHPLAFPALFSIAFDVAFSPLHLITPFQSAAKPLFDYSPSWSYYLSVLGRSDYSIYNSILSLVVSVFLASKYVGFYLGRRAKFRPLSTQTPRYANGIPVASAIFVSIAIISGIAFILSRGGIGAQIISFNEGRYLTMQGDGAFTVIVKLSSIALMLWLVSRKSALKSPIFLSLFLALLPIYWLVDGSRSSVMLLVLSLLIAFTFSNNKIPVRGLAGSAVFAFLFFGAIGIIRQDYSASNVDYSALELENYNAWIERSRQETKKRAAEEGDLAGLVAANKGDLLLGRSYVSIAAYPIPRALWPEKPKNAFYYNAWVAFLGNDIYESAPSIWGIPISESVEAYWNFSWLGVVLAGLVVGGLLGALTRIFATNPHSPAVAVAFIISIIYLTGGSRQAFYWIQYISALSILVLGAAGIARLTRTRAGA